MCSLSLRICPCFFLAIGPITRVKSQDSPVRDMVAWKREERETVSQIKPAYTGRSQRNTLDQILRVLNRECQNVRLNMGKHSFGNAPKTYNLIRWCKLAAVMASRSIQKVMAHLHEVKMPAWFIIDGREGIKRLRDADMLNGYTKWGWEATLDGDAPFKECTDREAPASLFDVGSSLWARAGGRRDHYRSRLTESRGNRTPTQPRPSGITYPSEAIYGCNNCNAIIVDTIIIVSSKFRVVAKEA